MPSKKIDTQKVLAQISKARSCFKKKEYEKAIKIMLKVKREVKDGKKAVEITNLVDELIRELSSKI